MKTLQQALVQTGWAKTNQKQQPNKKKAVKVMKLKNPLVIDQDYIAQRVAYKKATKESKNAYDRIIKLFPELQAHIGEWSETLTIKTDYWAEYNLFQHPEPIKLHKFSKNSWYGDLECMLQSKVGYYDYDVSHRCGSGYQRIITTSGEVIPTPRLKDEKTLAEFLAEKRLSITDIKFIIKFSSDSSWGNHGTYNGRYINIYYNDLI